MDIPRPLQHLSEYNKKYPDAWKQIDMFRADRGKALPWWPEWCFCPLSGAHTIVWDAAGGRTPPLDMLPDIGALGALAAWRVTKGIYRFDPDIYREIVETPISGNIPHEVLFLLPEWCIYIETPEMKGTYEIIYGYFAYLEYDVHTGRKELRLLLDVVDEKREILVPYALHLGDWSLDESIQRMEAESKKNVDKFYPELNYPGMEEDAPPLAEIRVLCEPLLSLLLYLCSANGEIAKPGDPDSRPSNPKPVKTKRGPRLFPPDKVTTWDVGVRMGAAIRRGRIAAASSEPEGPTGRTVRSHIRRAHWHSYWTGPRKEPEKRKIVLQWLHPILVGDGDGPAIIHSVE